MFSNIMQQFADVVIILDNYTNVEYEIEEFGELMREKFKGVRQNVVYENGIYKYLVYYENYHVAFILERCDSDKVKIVDHLITRQWLKNQ
jgi:hypothetical protein